MAGALLRAAPAGPRPLPAAAGPATLSLRPAHAIQAALLLLVVGNLGRLPGFSTGEREAPILFNDLCVAAVLCIGGLAMAQARVFRLDRVALTALGFVAVGTASTLLSVPRFGLTPFEVIVSLAYLARWVFYFALYVVVVNTVRERDVGPILRAHELGVIVFASFGIVQSALLPDFAQLVYPESRAYVDWDPQGHRLVSTFLDPNFAGMFILTALLVQIARLSQGIAIARWRPVLLLAALLLTASRSSILALAVGGAVVVLVAGVSRRLLQLIGVLLLLLAAALPKIIVFALAYNKLGLDASALGRVVMWGRGLTVLRDHPVIGIGFNAWGFVQERYGWERLGVATYAIEGGLLFTAVMTGAIGLTVYLLMLKRIVARARSVWRDPRRDPEHRAVAVAGVAVLAALVVHSLFTNSLYLTFLLEPTWILWGLGFVVAAAPVAADPPPAIAGATTVGSSGALRCPPPREPVNW